MIDDKTSGLIPPSGGTLADSLVPAEARNALQELLGRLRSLQLSKRWVCDLELLAMANSSQVKTALHHPRTSWE